MRIFLPILIMLFSGCAIPERTPTSVQATAISPDGAVAATTHLNGIITIWNIQEQIYRPQDIDVLIHGLCHYEGEQFSAQLPNGQIILFSADDTQAVTSFPPAYSLDCDGQENSYVASDVGYGVQAYTRNNRMTLRDPEGQTYFAYGKSLDLHISPSRRTVLSSGFTSATDSSFYWEEIDGRPQNNDGVTLWDTDTGTPQSQLVGNWGRTYAAFSPDGNYIVTVDDNESGFVWDAEDKKHLHRLEILGAGLWIGGSDYKSDQNWDRSGTKLKREDGTIPEDFERLNQNGVQFISRRHFLVFHKDQQYSVLYEVGNPFAIKLFDLGTWPQPSTDGYSRNQSIATAPLAGILVTGQRHGAGINVYRFDEEELTLERIWAPQPPVREMSSD